MSNFNLIDQTKTNVTSSDLLVAGSIVGSFLFFVIKSQRNKVLVLHKKNKSKEEVPAIESQHQETIKSHTELTTMKSSLPFKSKVPIKTFMFNPMTLKAFQGKNNAFDLLRENKDMNDFMSLIPKPKQIPIERMLLTESELEELREIATHKKKERLGQKHLLTEGYSPEENEEQWSIREYDAQDFDLENVYDDFLDSQKRRILQKHTRKNSSSNSRRNFSVHRSEKPKSNRPRSLLDSPFISNVSENNEHLPDIIVNIDGEGGGEEEKEEKNNESFSNIAKRTSTLEIESPEAKAILKRYEDTAKKLTPNPFNSGKTTFVTRKDAEQRALLISNMNINCLLNVNENGDCLVSSRLMFNLKSLDYEEELFLDYSGKYVLSISINQKSLKPSEVWFENKIHIPAKYLKEGQNIIYLLVQTESLESIQNPSDNEEEKFIDPNILKEFHSYIYFTGPGRKTSTFLPIFDQPGFLANIILGVLIPKNYYILTSSLEKLNQPIKEDSRFNSLSCHEAVFNNIEDFIDKRLLLFQMKTDLTELGLCIGELSPIYEKENIRFFSTQQNKEKLLEALTPASEIMQLSLCTYKKFLKNNVSKIDIIVLPGLSKRIFGYQGLIFVNEKLLLSQENLAEFYSLILKELAKQFLMTRMKWYDDLWIFEGLSQYLSSTFFEQIGDFDNITQNLPFNEIMAYISSLKQKALFIEVMEWAHPLYFNIEDNYEYMALQKKLLRFKPVYLFKQIYAMRGKKSLAEILLKMGHYITNKEMIELLKEAINFQQDNENTNNIFEDWLLSKSLSEIHINIQANPLKNTLIKEFVINQSEYGKKNNEPHSLKRHYTDLTLLNQSCRKQFSLEIKIEREKQTIYQELEGKFYPKAILIDSDDYGYFRLKIDEKSLTFLIENLYKLDEPKTRLQLYYAFYFEMLDGQFNQLFFLETVLKHLEKENSYVVLKKILKLCYFLLFLGFEKEKEVEYSEKFLYLIIKLIEQGKAPALLYKFIRKFAVIPQSTTLLESIFLEKHTSLTRYYKNFSDKSRMKLLARVLSCESIGPEKRDKYIEDFIGNMVNFELKEQARLLFRAVSPSEEEKEKVWLIFSENVKEIKREILKPAMRNFIQNGQYLLNTIFVEKYFEELPIIINKHDEQYAYLFTKSLFPMDLLNEEYLFKINKALEKIDLRNEPKIHKFLREKAALGKKMRDVLESSTEKFEKK